MLMGRAWIHSLSAHDFSQTRTPQKHSVIQIGAGLLGLCDPAHPVMLEVSEAYWEASVATLTQAFIGESQHKPAEF